MVHAGGEVGGLMLVSIYGGYVQTVAYKHMVNQKGQTGWILAFLSSFCRRFEWAAAPIVKDI